MILAPIVEIFCDIDEFYKNYEKELTNEEAGKCEARADEPPIAELREALSHLW